MAAPAWSGGSVMPSAPARDRGAVPQSVPVHLDQSCVRLLTAEHVRPPFRSQELCIEGAE